MHVALEQFFAEHATPSHTTKDEVHAALLPIVDLGNKMHAQVTEYKSLLLTAKLSPHDHAIDGKLEMVGQTLGAVTTKIVDFLRLAETIANDFVQLDKLVVGAFMNIHNYETATTSSNGPQASGPAAPGASPALG